MCTTTSYVQYLKYLRKCLTRSASTTAHIRARTDQRPRRYTGACWSARLLVCAPPSAIWLLSQHGLSHVTNWRWAESRDQMAMAALCMPSPRAHTDSSIRHLAAVDECQQRAALSADFALRPRTHLRTNLYVSWTSSRLHITSHITSHSQCPLTLSDW